MSLGQVVQPQFTQDVYNASVTETTGMIPPPQDGFLTVRCDNVENITYSILSPANAGPFIIDSTTGDLSAPFVDYEAAPLYQFEVGCSNVNDPMLNDTAVVVIMVEPVNEFIAHISVMPSFIAINELTPVGTMLASTSGNAQAMITVTDQDAPPDNLITFHLTVGDPNFESFFSINANTGSVSLIRTFDRDMQTPPGLFTVFLIITACDTYTPVDQCSNSPLTIIVFESNDNLPIFSQNTYIVTESEFFPVNEIIATVNCTDADRGTGAFEQYIISGIIPVETPNDTFAIDTITGNITLLRPLDYEFTQVYEIIVLCRDTEGVEDNATILISVTDENDNSPNVTTFFNNVIDINDRIPINSGILQFQCTDEDSNENGNITYSIDVDNSSFTIDDITGNVTVSSSLVLPDDVFTTIVNFTLVCSDQGNPPLSDYTAVVVEIYKDDSTAPIIINSSISNGLVSISESDPIGTQLLQVMAVDTTSPELIYSLRDESSPGTFEINSNSGVIILTEELDREMNDMYSFSVVVTEVRVAPGMEESAEAAVVVEILDENDNDPVFSEVIYMTTVSEDLAIGEMVINVSCSDADVGVNDTSIDYLITGGSPYETFPGTFAIDETTGTITILSSLDYEFSPTYTIDVVCLDSGGRQNGTTIEITVTDVNDNTPIPTMAYDDVIQVNDQSEVTFSVVQFQCTDEDSSENANITYSIDFNNGSFTIDEITGNVAVASSLILPEDVFERDLNITVVCSDQGNPSLSASSTISFEIYKNDSTPPVIDRDSISNSSLGVPSVSISEGALLGTQLVQIQAMDATSPSLRYSLVNESSPGVFEINPTSGVITLSQPLDREVIETYTFTVVATEVRVAPGLARTDLVQIRVVILDINDNPPAFSQDVYNITRLESFATNETIFTVTCTDMDTSINGRFSRYELSRVLPNTVASDTFTIDRLDGNITLLKPLDYELSPTYTITVLCFDNEDMQDTAVVEINLVDVNDNDPSVETFFNDPILINNAQPIGYTVLRFQCSDSDSGDNGNVSYILENTTPLFSITPFTGDVMVMSPLTLPSGQFLVNYNITIRCSDQGNPQRSSGDTILFQVYKDDSTIPVIDATSISNGRVNISERAQIGDVLVRVVATDTTSPSLRYELVSESSPGTFVIDSTSGIVTVAEPLDREAVPFYTFQIVVSEVKIGTFAGPVRRDRESVNVTIQDVNDNQPICNEGKDIARYVLVGNYSSNNTLMIARLMCIDRDAGNNATITLTAESLPSVSSGQFSLNATSGEVIFTGILTENATYTILIEASDEGDPPLSSIVNITLNVSGERINELTNQERLLLIIILPISGGLLLFACFMILCMCCCCCVRKRKKAKDTYNLWYAENG